MSMQKGLTLQEYIEVYNIKKQLKERSKQKQRQQSIQKSQTYLTLQPVDNTLSQTSQYLRGSFNQSIYDKVDSRARNLNKELEEKIKEIKMQCRELIRDNKDFSYFIEMMDQLMDMFRLEVMRIHRQNLVLFKVTENELSALTQRGEMGRSILQKSFHNQYVDSKIDYEQNMKNLRKDSNKKSSEGRDNHHMKVKYNDLRVTERESSGTENGMSTVVKSLPITSSQSIMPVVQQQKFVKDINQLNTTGGKVNPKIEKIDDYYSISFGSHFYTNNNKTGQIDKTQQINTNRPISKVVKNSDNLPTSNNHANIPKSPSHKSDNNTDHKILSSPSKTPTSKLKSKVKPLKDTKYESIRSSQYAYNIQNTPELKKRRTKTKQKIKKSSTNKQYK